MSKTLLDEFAMAAMQGDFAAQNESNGSFPLDFDISKSAKHYYRMARAMMEEKQRIEKSEQELCHDDDFIVTTKPKL